MQHLRSAPGEMKFFYLVALVSRYGDVCLSSSINFMHDTVQRIKYGHFVLFK